MSTHRASLLISLNYRQDLTLVIVDRQLSSRDYVHARAMRTVRPSVRLSLHYSSFIATKTRYKIKT